jgi:pimeloyl-ACP methyl ester carboxylesterase
MRHRAGVIVVAVLTLAGHPAVSAAAQPASPEPRAELEWSGCFRREASQIREFLGDPTIRFQCATLVVPLDHDEPDGPTIEVAVNRLPARQQATRTGSLIVNPGGPGGSGVDFTVFGAAFIYPDQIRDNFDIVSFDPRGVGRSTVLRCFGQPSGYFALAPPFLWPETDREVARQRRFDRALSAACRDRDPAILAHMSTANVARDMDLLREAVGDEQLTYQGFSYGTYLGVVYANLFPDNVRALVVDGVLDPVAWSGRGQAGRTLVLEERLGSGPSANATLQQFFRLCNAAGPSRCALAPDARSRYRALLRRARQEPIVVVDPGSGESFTLGRRDIVSQSLGALYNSPSWGQFAADLAFVEGAAGLGPRDAPALPRAAPFPEEPRYPGVESFLGVVCSETNSPARHGQWVQAATDAAEPFGPLWTWTTSPCAFWPAADEDRFTGPYTGASSTPLLVASTTFDPATPYQGALAVRALAPGSRLITVDGWGHTMFGLSACGDAVVAAYLLDQTLPSVDVTCPQDIDPFAPRPRDATPSARDRLVAIVAGDPLPL